MSLHALWSVFPPGFGKTAPVPEDVFIKCGMNCDEPQRSNHLLKFLPHRHFSVGTERVTGAALFLPPLRGILPSGYLTSNHKHASLTFTETLKLISLSRQL